MGTGLPASEFNGRGKRLDNSLVQLKNLPLLLPDLIALYLYLPVQLSSGPEKFHHAFYPFFHKIRDDRFLDNIHHAQVIASPHTGIRCIRRNKEYRYFSRQTAFMQHFQKFKAIHHGHHNIQQHRGNTIGRVQHIFQRLLSILRLHDPAAVLEGFAEHRPVDLHVIYDQNRFSSTHFLSLKYFFYSCILCRE